MKRNIINDIVAMCGALLIISQTIPSKLAIASELFVEELERQLNHTDLFFDLTGIKNKNFHHFNITSLQYNKSSHFNLFYVNANENTTDDICWTDYYKDDVTDLPCGLWFGITGLSFLFDKPDDLTEVLKLPIKPLTNQTILHLLNTANEVFNAVILLVKVNTRRSGINTCYCDLVNKNLNDYIKENLAIVRENHKMNSSHKLGFEYTEDLMDCCKDEVFSVLDHVNFTVLRVELSPQEMLFSYEIMSGMINNIVKKHEKFLVTLNPECRVFIRIVLQKSPEMSLEVFSRYKSLIAKYMNAQFLEPSQHNIFIIVPYTQSTHIEDNKRFMREKVSPVFINCISSDCRLSKGCIFGCQTQATIKSIAFAFNRFAYSNPDWKDLCGHLMECMPLRDIEPQKQFRNPKSTMMLNFYSEGKEIYQAAFTKLAEMFEVFNLQAVYFNHKFSTWNSSKLEYVFNLLDSQNIEIGCCIEFSDLSNMLNHTSVARESKRLCGKLFNKSSLILYGGYIDIDFDTQLPQLLSGLDKTKKKFEYQFPKKRWVPSLILFEGQKHPTKKTTLKKGIVKQTIFCDARNKQINNYYDAIVTFANVHNWESIYLRSVLDDNLSSGWWRNIKTDPRINRSISDFPVLMRSNVGNQVDESVFPYTYPCIEWQDSPNKLGIGFIQNQNSGISFDMDLRRQPVLQLNELSMLLLLALGRFSSVEIILKGKDDFNIAKQTISLSIIETVKASRKLEKLNMPLVYLEVLITENIYDQLENIYFNELFNMHVVALSLAGWEEHAVVPINNISTTTLRKFKVGITVQNCMSEINVKLSRVKNLQFIKDVTYVICNMDEIPGQKLYYSTKELMTMYFDTLYYIKTYIETFLTRNIEVIFRIPFEIPKKCADTKKNLEGYLKFVNQINEHSLVYKYKYFLFPAFEQEWLNLKCARSWWNIENYTDLSNISNFKDMEEVYFGRKTPQNIRWPSLNDENVKILNDSTGKNTLTIIAIVTVMSVVFLFAISAMWWKLRGAKRRYLTDMELHKFYNGDIIDNAMIDAKSVDWLRLKFPENLEIPKSHIHIGRTIGSGEFGEVHYGTLLDEIEVAVKMPAANGGRENFKSVLAEVKILSYIGTHTNVVLFYGACTKRIARGELYVITELCKMGSLQSFLRMLQYPQKNVDLYQLYDFCQQIASGMAYIAERQVVHGDLSTRNIFLTNDFTCKIGDFGLSRRLYELEQYIKESKEPLPWRWMAPETLKNMVFTTNSDVWSYGVTIWEVFSLGMVPYPGLSWSPDFINKLETGLRMGKPELATDNIYNMILKCWSEDTDDRPSFISLSKYFAGIKNSEYTSL